MFELNHAVAQWRQRMNAQPDIQDGDVEEMEDHLRETVADLQRAGLTDEEAFLIASRRLGDPEALAGEFAVADPGLRRRLRLRWMVVGALAMLALAFLGDFFANLVTGATTWLSVSGPRPFMVGPWLGWTGGALRAVVFVVGALLVWRLLTSDAVAGRSHRLWSAGLMGAGILAFAWLVLAALGGVGSRLVLSHGVPPEVMIGVSSVTVLFRTALLLLLPMLLILMLWWLARPRGGAR
jgi:hypothetical protein